MKHEYDMLAMKIEQSLPSMTVATVTVDKPYIALMYHETLLKQKKGARVHGFSQGTTPLNYLERTYKIPIMEHLQEFLLSTCVLNFLSYQLTQHKIVVIGQPRLRAVTMDPEQSASFEFELTTAAPKISHEWDKYLFRAPGRKNYRDLDKQVELFLKEETEQTIQCITRDAIKVDDWICFTIQAVDSDQKPLLGNFKDIVWLKIGDEETDEEAQHLFLHKKVGDRIFTQATFLQDHVSNTFDSQYHFSLEIIEHAPHAIFCFESFKKHFKLKTIRELHLKLIEVFSYRHDISQRRETIEAALKALVRHHPFSVPDHLVAQQKEAILETMHINPDYYVYKSQPDFKEKVHMLAEKQLKELIIIDSLAYKENIHVTQEDIMGYINLMKRPRTREFIYFALPATKIYGREIPFPHELIRQQCLREKTLNHTIHRFTKR